LKNSFFLVIPKQQKASQRLKEFEAKNLQQWLAELPAANLALSARLLYDFITSSNALEMPLQLRLDCLELLSPSLIPIVDYLQSQLTKTGFPKDEYDKKVFKLLIALQKEFTTSYWIVLKELTAHDVGWFQGKNTALSIQRTIKGLNSIAVSHFIMGFPMPHWVWLDLHSLFKLSVKIKKHAVKIENGVSRFNKTSSPEECYLQIILLSLADPFSLTQKEVLMVYHFAETLVSQVDLRNEPIASQSVQSIILTDEDKPPHHEPNVNAEPVLYIDFTKLIDTFEQNSIPVSMNNGRFSSLQDSVNMGELPTFELLFHLKQRWLGHYNQSAPIFNDRLDRYIAIGLSSTFKLQQLEEINSEEELEFLVQSLSSRLLSCVFNKTGVLSIGSLVSFRKTDAPEHKRLLGIVDRLMAEQETGKISFGIQLLALQCTAVTYIPIGPLKNNVSKKALFYHDKGQNGKSYIIFDTFILKEGDIIRLFINHDEFHIMLKNKKNIGSGYWQFECMKAVKREN